ncbi:hypothetical protein IC235_07205 [Hymenobacter sp. BT664]|uniref:Uncharacterized protein n=1 Tax=Hymenobacter montanus TaxID=2771359 RepID=A0A927BBF9_9BACT|nr:hypothetical protein [Hymenobacter montanus]MBD2767677.1 hypothetical protein [Hymenobacter montanus]
MPRYSLFRRFVSLLLAVLVLAAAVGINVQRQACRMSGRSTVVLALAGPVALRGCPERPAGPRPVAKSSCCDFSSHLHKLSDPAHERTANVKVPAPMLVALAPSVTGLGPLLMVAPVAGGVRWLTTDSSPPPRGGRELLAFVCTLVV